MQVAFFQQTFKALSKMRQRLHWICFVMFLVFWVGNSPSLFTADQVMANDGPWSQQVQCGGEEGTPVEEEPADGQAKTEEKSSVAAESQGGGFWKEKYPLIVLAVGIVIVLGLILGAKLNAFLALITAAVVVSLMSGGPWSEKISRTAEAFGTRTGQIGLVIAMAAVIGKCMLDSGSADRIVRFMVALFGDRFSSFALMASGFILAIPVFFDTVFYLLVPLARSLYRRTRKNYLLYLLAIAAGGAITHTLVPPTPGPLMMASQLGFPLGNMILIGALVAAPAALAGVIFAWICNRWMPLPMRAQPGETESEPLADNELPPLWLSLLPVVLPVALISGNTIMKATMGDPTENPSIWLNLAGIFGNPNFALMISTAIALITLVVHRKVKRTEMAKVVELALMSGGVIILITAAGGAFGDMLKVAGVGEAISGMFGQGGTEGMSGLKLLILGFSLAALLKVAQGSSTVAMIVGSAMLAEFAGSGQLGYHPVYLACAIGTGSLVGSWMNDSGFWIFAKMGGLTEVEALKSWTILLIVMGFVGFAATLGLAVVLPYPFGAP